MMQGQVSRTLRYVGHAAISGTIGWVALIAIFEGAYWAEAYLGSLRRK